MKGQPVILLIAHVKGGSGKSTVAVNMAAELQARGQDLVIVEADPTVRTTSNWALVRESSGQKPVKVIRETGDLRTTLEELERIHGTVLVDLPGKDSTEMRTAMVAAGALLIPMQPTQPDMDTVAPMVEILTRARTFNPGLRALGVLNRVSTNVFSSQVADAREYMKDWPEIRMLEARLHERSSYQTAMDRGLGVVETRDRKARTEIQTLTTEATAW